MNTPPVHDGYGFRPPSGASTPLNIETLVPDSNGLGWPGLFFPHLLSLLLFWADRSHVLAKSTFSRLAATAEERAAREKKMATAVRTILECIGEDPDREGLLKTPERYAQAIMWMTRGYEERLAGACYPLPSPASVKPKCHSSPRCHKRCCLCRRPRRDGHRS
jgi:GTP cyclohydrolase I